MTNLQDEAAHYNACLAWIASNATSAISSKLDACDARAILDDIHSVAGDGLNLRALIAPPVRS